MLYPQPVGYRVLVVDDDPELAVPLVSALIGTEHHTDWVATGAEALAYANQNKVDLALLDIGLPDMNGLDTCRDLRRGGYDGAVIIVSGKSSELDQVHALDSGADDYVVKPFGLALLQARIRAVLRRATPRPMPGRASVALDTAGRRVAINGREVPFTSREFDVLRELLASDGAVVSREALLTAVWSDRSPDTLKTIDVAVGRVRQKLSDSGARVTITTVRGLGFRLDIESDSAPS